MASPPVARARRARGACPGAALGSEVRPGFSPGGARAASRPPRHPRPLGGRCVCGPVAGPGRRSAWAGRARWSTPSLPFTGRDVRVSAPAPPRSARRRSAVAGPRGRPACPSPRLVLDAARSHFGSRPVACRSLTSRLSSGVSSQGDGPRASARAVWVALALCAPGGTVPAPFSSWLTAPCLPSARLCSPPPSVGRAVLAGPASSSGGGLVAIFARHQAARRVAVQVLRLVRRPHASLAVLRSYLEELLSVWPCSTSSRACGSRAEHAHVDAAGTRRRIGLATSPRGFPCSWDAEKLFGCARHARRGSDAVLAGTASRWKKKI